MNIVEQEKSDEEARALIEALESDQGSPDDALLLSELVEMGQISGKLLDAAMNILRSSSPILMR